METIEILRRHGLFDASVPRYTSYPPANHFVPDLGRRRQRAWLQAVPEGAEVSVYIHIPFCRRLCWFCACRTQGTATLGPVESYVDTLLQEIDHTAATLPRGVRMARLHLGGGTPTLLSPDLMRKLLGHVFAALPPNADAEFSIEVDPTEAAPDLIEELAHQGLTRASLGVQDFAPAVQEAIGRQQSVGQTLRVVEMLRRLGVDSLNIDLLYGLPWQTEQSFAATLAQVQELDPDRLAIYGYAHVPWVSKRQILIPVDVLPDPEARFWLAEQARGVFTSLGYQAIGIDHFAKPGDGLARAQANGSLSRNFQGYTDDPAETLIGFGASAISKFAQGYSQNAPATSAYQARVRDGQLAGHKGIEMSPKDLVLAGMINDLMCSFAFDPAAATGALPELGPLIASLVDQFGDVLRVSDHEIALKPAFHPLARILAHHLDAYVQADMAHAAAI